MDDEQIKKIIEDTYDVSKEDTIWSMAGDFYNKKMLSVVIIVWGWAIIFMAIIVYSGIQFFRAEQTKFQIMYAAIFICCAQFIVLIKIFAWQFIHKNSLKREIKRLELRIAELAEIVKNK
jgi:uncharacterized membrane protein YidH (DUF202 family)